MAEHQRLDLANRPAAALEKRIAWVVLGAVGGRVKAKHIGYQSE